MSSHPLDMYTPKKKAPMTAAERQQRCRANGKGRHRNERGRITGPEADRRRRSWHAMIAYHQAIEDAEVAAAAGADPVVLPEPPCRIAASPAIVSAPVIATPPFDWTLSAMAA